jgi:hypothetical protein
MAIRFGDIAGVAYDHEPLHRFETEVIPLIDQPSGVHSVAG